MTLTVKSHMQLRKPASARKPKASSTLKTAILETLFHKPRVFSELRELLHVGSEAIQLATDALIGEGKITREEGRFGKFRIVESASEPATNDDLADQVVAHVESLIDATQDDVGAALDRLHHSLQAPVITITDYDLKLSVLSRLGEIVEASIADVLLSVRADLQMMHKLREAQP